jgi:hypothetical protein
MNYTIFGSRTFWTAAFLTIYNVSAALGTIYLASWLLTAVDIVGFVLVTCFHVNPSQYYSAGIGLRGLKMPRSRLYAAL